MLMLTTVIFEESGNENPEKVVHGCTLVTCNKTQSSTLIHS